MTTGYLVYKCRLCGDTHKPVGIPNIYLAMISVITNTPFPEEWGGGDNIDLMVTVHNCSNGSMGVSDLIGAEPKREYKKYILDYDAFINAPKITNFEDVRNYLLMSDGIDTLTAHFDPGIGREVFMFSKKPTDYIDLGIKWLEKD